MSARPQDPGRFAIVVAFRARPDFRDAFRRAVLENAAASLRHEPGCHVFDVCEDAASGEFLLYELYASAQAFEAHLATEHFRAFDAGCRDWVASKQVRRYERLLNRA